MRISIVVQVFNAESYLERSINALLSQDYTSDQYEIIMVDNNSTDRSSEIIHQYPSVRLLQQSKQGSYAARNIGIAEAAGSIIAFLDADCVPCSRWLRSIASTMREPDVSVVIGRIQSGATSPSLLLYDAYEHTKHDYIFGTEDAELYYGHTNNMAVRRNLLDGVRPFMEWERGADTELVRRVVDAYSSRTVRYCAEALVRHLEIDSILTVYRKNFLYARSRRRHSQVSPLRTLALRERFTVISRTVRLERYPVTKAAMLLGLLSVGVLCWYAGSLSAVRAAHRGIDEHDGP